MKPGDLVYINDITRTDFVLGIVLRVMNPFPDDPHCERYERCEVFWNGEPPHWIRGSVLPGIGCSSHFLKVVK